ncbi:E3 ubiquitin-protein ligase TRIM36-like [Haliotis rufescens]|uniref:E3 ubiquitin-protein ligase TRIM36-like n=1 Tax=Haliotis rufescens TaxID=6454 RepID=UPI00201F4151|nr:E3 ubiquitin-protein ligase TRIM36-like [Haliotis rufescens]
MATPQDLTDKFLKCAICFNVYTHPCTLNCGHTFCQGCLLKFVETKSGAVQSKSIPCPCCRQDTKVPDPSRPVGEWVTQIKPSIIIQGLIESLSSEGNHASDGGCPARQCSVCKKQGAKRKHCMECDTLFCTKCGRSHLGSHTHTLRDLTETISSNDRCRVMCKEHKQKCIEFHCNNCQTSACGTCCILYHRTCSSLVTIESMKSQMEIFISRKVAQTSAKVDLFTKKVSVLEVDMAMANSIADSVKERIISVTEAAIREIEEKKKKKISELEELLAPTQAHLKTSEIELQMHQQHREFMKRTLHAGNHMELYIACMSTETDKLSNLRDKEDGERIERIDFTENTDIMDIQLGKISLKYNGDSNLISVPQMYKTIDSRTDESDMKDPFLLDITVLSVNGRETVVVSDTTNTCLKSFFDRNYQSCSSKLSFENAPRGIAKLSENQVMCTVTGQLAVVNVTPDLVLSSTIATSRSYTSLAFPNPSSLVAGGIGSVDILNTKYQVVKTFTTHNDDTLFMWPGYMCVCNYGNILVSDWCKKSVTCLTPDGNVGVYKPTGDRALSNPRGIATTYTGDILLANDNKVLQLTESGEFVRDVLTSRDGITLAQGLCVDRKGSLFVCDGSNIKAFIFA